MWMSLTFFILLISTTLSSDKILSPRNVVVTSATPRTQNITWKEPSINNNSIIYYVIRGRNQYNDEWTKATTIPPTVTSSACMVTGLLPNNKYSYKVAAVTQMGQGEWSRRSTAASTQLAAPVRAPVEVMGKEVRPGMLLITWKPLQRKYFGSPDVTYEIIIGKIWQQAGLILSNNSGIPEVSDLSWQPEKSFNTKVTRKLLQVKSYVERVAYRVEVRARNEIGTGSFSKPIVVYSAAVDGPAPPHGFHVDWNDAYNVKLSWKYDVNKNTSIKGYKLCVCNLIQGCQAELLLNLSTDTNKSNFKISGLQPGYLYMVKMASYNDAGTGRWSASQWNSLDPGILMFYTASPPPDISPDVLSISVEKNHVEIMWSPPVVVVTKVIGYYVEIWFKNQTSKDAIRKETKNLKMELDLAPRSNFFMWVRAYNKGGPGRPSDVFVISTLNETSWKYVEPDSGGGATSVDFDMVFLMLSLIFMLTMSEIMR